MESKLKGYARTEVVPYDGNVGTTLQAINECKVLLGVRLHGCIFAYACQVPFAAVAYHPKVTDFCREIGLPEELIFPAEGRKLKIAGNSCFPCCKTVIARGRPTCCRWWWHTRWQ